VEQRVKSVFMMLDNPKAVGIETDCGCRAIWLTDARAYFRCCSRHDISSDSVEDVKQHCANRADVLTLAKQASMGLMTMHQVFSEVQAH
jgi:hypothetical protein